MSSTTASTSAAFLIFGDWVVDEYWFLVRHQSDVSSHTGLVHYRISTEPKEVISALCGAGHVARVLYALRAATPGLAPDLWGLGSWHPADTEILSHLVHCGDTKAEQPCPADRMSFRLVSETCATSPAASGIHLRCLINAQHTVQVIRLYHQEGAHLEQISRIDWEPKPASLQPSTRLLEFELPNDLPSSLNLIIVEDYVKGAVTPNLVRALCRNYPNARWHVRTKDKTRAWLELVRDKLDLLVIGPEVASLTKPWRSWLADDRLTFQALELLRDGPQNIRNLVILTEQREVIARLGDKQCITARSNVERNPLSDIGWPSAFFAALSWQIRCRSKEDDETTSEEAIRNALQHADEYGTVKPPLSTGIGMQALCPATVARSAWNEELKTWQEAMSELGIIKRDGRSFLDVWRASTNLPGYVACIEKKQQVIDRIGRYIRKFAQHPDVSSSLSIMLQADPGSGKTFLAQSLARAFHCSYLPFDITQMMHREDLLDVFDTISAQQAESVRKNERERPVLVFIDEINGRIDNDYTYGAFLAPLEGGFYVRHGRHVILRPCVWLFAGTRMDPAKMGPGDKISDFRSRMTMYEEIDFSSLKSRYQQDNALGRSHMSDPSEVVQRLYSQARLEQVYIGVSMINKLFPDVRRISEDVLFGFWKLDPEKSPARILRKLATAFVNVQHGVITKGNWDDQYEEISKGYIYEALHKMKWLEPPERGQSLVELRFRAAESQG